MRKFIIFLITIINTVLCVFQSILTESNIYLFIMIPCFGLLIALLCFNSDIDYRFIYSSHKPYIYNFTKTYKNVVTREK